MSLQQAGKAVGDKKRGVASSHALLDSDAFIEV